MPVVIVVSLIVSSVIEINSLNQEDPRDPPFGFKTESNPENRSDQMSLFPEDQIQNKKQRTGRFGSRLKTEIIVYVPVRENQEFPVQPSAIIFFRSGQPSRRRRQDGPLTVLPGQSGSLLFGSPSPRCLHSSRL